MTHPDHTDATPRPGEERRDVLLEAVQTAFGWLFGNQPPTTRTNRQRTDHREVSGDGR